MPQSVIERFGSADFPRRQFLRASGVSVGAFVGSSIGAAFGGSGSAASNAPAKRAIVLFLQGGCSQLDSWDMKPNAPVEYRGEFDSIATATAGYRVCEHLPMLAARTPMFNVLRSVHHGTPSHEAAIHWVLTGYDYPGANTTTKNRNDKPSVGSLVAKVKGSGTPGLPAYFCVPDKGQLGDRVRYADSHFLGMAYSPFESGPVPVDADSPYRVPQPLVMFRDMAMTRFDERAGLLQQLDQFQRAADASGTMHGMDQFRRIALDMITHPVTQAAIDLGKESAETRQRYGSNKFGQRVLMARRLAEAGVPFTLVNLADNQDWDTHVDNFKSLKTRLLPLLDRAVATLLDELSERGLLDSTLVAIVSEFGRTPKINNNVGRDHWSDVFSVVLTGGGLKSGHVLGTSNPRAEIPQDRPIHYNDVLATMYHQLGIDTTRIFMHEGRPVPILYQGTPIAELV